MPHFFKYTVKDAAKVSAAGYGYFNAEVIQNLYAAIPLVKETMDNVGGVASEVLRNQGTDFFAAPFLAYTLGSAATYLLAKATNMISPQKSISKFVEKNSLIVNSAVTFAGLAMYELHDAAGKNAELDVKDIAAYGLGLLTICHGDQIRDFCRNKFNIGGKKTDDKKSFWTQRLLPD